MALTRILDCAYFIVSDFVRLIIVVFVKAYVVSLGSVIILLVIEDIIIMRLFLRVIIFGSIVFVTFYTFLILMLIWKSRSLSFISRKLFRR